MYFLDYWLIFEREILYLDFEEILRYIRLSKKKTVSVERNLLPQYPGIVRDIAVLPDSRICVSFFDKNITFSDEASVVFYLYFENNSKLLRSLEKFFSCRISNWHNYNEENIIFPDCYSTDVLDRSWLAFKRDFADRKIAFPVGWTKFVISDPYWEAIWDGKLKPDASFEEIALWARQNL